MNNVIRGKEWKDLSPEEIEKFNLLKTLDEQISERKPTETKEGKEKLLWIVENIDKDIGKVEAKIEEMKTKVEGLKEWKVLIEEDLKRLEMSKKRVNEIRPLLINFFLFL